jgi:glutaminase
VVGFSDIVPQGRPSERSRAGGSILVIVPGRATVVVKSPGLNPTANSTLGTLGSLALEMLVRETGWNVFEGGIW